MPSAGISSLRLAKPVQMHQSASLTHQCIYLKKKVRESPMERTSRQQNHDMRSPSCSGCRSGCVVVEIGGAAAGFAAASAVGGDTAAAPEAHTATMSIAAFSWSAKKKGGFLSGPSSIGATPPGTSGRRAEPLRRRKRPGSTRPGGPGPRV